MASLPPIDLPHGGRTEEAGALGKTGGGEYQGAVVFLVADEGQAGGGTEEGGF